MSCKIPYLDNNYQGQQLKELRNKHINIVKNVIASKLFYKRDGYMRLTIDLNSDIRRKQEEYVNNIPELSIVQVDNKDVLSVKVDNEMSSDNYVNYTLKSVKILLSDKAKQVFEKGEKANWDLNKILTELQIPKEQKQLILDLGKTNREEIITDLLANYSYTVEINTATKVINEPKYEYNEFGEGFQTGEELVESKADFYSGLTVPGGTNYTENEIATPAITPSIKGHAQFSTPNGIGWFRSDESQQYQEADIQSIIDNLQKSGQLEINCK